MPLSGVASIPEAREVAVRAVGVASEAERAVGTRAPGVRVETADEDNVARELTPGVAADVSDARGRGIDPIADALPAAETPARGVGSTPLVRPVSEALGFGIARVAAAVGVLSGEPPTLAADAVLVLPGVAGASDGNAGMGWAWMIAAAARDSRRRAGPETGGRELVNVLLRRLRMGVFSSLPTSAASDGAVGVGVGMVRDERPAEALPDRGTTASGFADPRDWSSRDPAVGVTSDRRGATRETGFTPVLAPAEGRVTVDVPVRAAATGRLGVLSTLGLPSCAFLAASAAHFCMLAASRS